MSPLRNELWWPACAILMAIALQVSLRRALAYCLIVLLANLTAHIVAGDLPDTSAVGIVGLWIGIPFWTAMAAVIPARMASHMLRLNATRKQLHVPPRRVTASSPRPSSDAPLDGDDPVADPDHQIDPADPIPSATPPEPEGVARADRTSRLTNRQLQVVALLADGHRYEYIGECLAITPGQVYRHVRNAVERLGVQNVNELVAVVVAEGVVPAPVPDHGHSS